MTDPVERTTGGGSLKARLIRIEFERGETGRIYAKSPDIKGLWIGRRSMEELEHDLPEAIAAMYAACGESVVVSKLENESTSGEAWVAFPSEIARR